MNYHTKMNHTFMMNYHTRINHTLMMNYHPKMNHTLMVNYYAKNESKCEKEHKITKKNGKFMVC